jgi:hypothetical protein
LQWLAQSNCRLKAADLRSRNIKTEHESALVGSIPKERPIGWLGSLNRQTAESQVFCAMRQSTPVGSTIVKSRMPQGRSSGGSARTSYFAAS